MAKVYIKTRPTGRYVVENHADHMLGMFRSQKDAIRWARDMGHSPFVAVVPQQNDKRNPNHWRSA